MLAANVYQPDQWHDFFVIVGTGAAALTGLVFVAMSLNPAVIAEDATHRYRAVGTLTGLGAVFLLCGLVLMGGQGHVAVGVEILTSSAAAAVFVSGYFRAKTAGGSDRSLSILRTIAGAICYLMQIAGGIILILGYIAGRHINSVGIVANMGIMISGAWLLVMRVRPTG